MDTHSSKERYTEHNPWTDSTPPSPEQLIAPHVSRKYPDRWGYLRAGKEWINTPLEPLQFPTEIIRGVVGVKNPEARLKTLAIALANTESIAARKERIETTVMFLKSLAADSRDTLQRLHKTEKKTPRTERVRNGRTEPKALRKLTMAQYGRLLVVGFWVALFGSGIIGELAIGTFNVMRAEMEGANGFIAICMALLPFIGTFTALKWLDPANIDLNRKNFEKWLTRIALVATPLAMYLFAWKLDALLETDFMRADAGTGPSFTSVVWTIQISFAVSIYLAAKKLGDAWYQFLGYEIRPTAEYQDVCQALKTALDSQRSIFELIGDMGGALAAIKSRENAAIEQVLGVYDRLVKQDADRRRRIEDEAAAAAANARLRATTESDDDDVLPAVA
ncbi:hypothetical protein [Planctomycetes bacterium TBK1r]|uniref:Uncharacterized protein n=1 Tax=Stieleria magnilauensis TaxID=2527963 RepID=A0ABX5XGV9_9BACT|nr:hypothetical protein TBK1r_01380 [Planctomycetes bacterium TBK1r]